MARLGAMYGPDVTFTGVPRCDLADPSSYADASAVIVGAPYDSGTSYRSGARMGPLAMRTCDYSEHTGSRPHLSLRVDPLLDLGVVDAGDIMMAADRNQAGSGQPAGGRLSSWRRTARSRWCWAATTPSRSPTSPVWQSISATAGSR